MIKYISQENSNLGRKYCFAGNDLSSPRDAAFSEAMSFIPKNPPFIAFPRPGKSLLAWEVTATFVCFRWLDNPMPHQEKSEQSNKTGTCYQKIIEMNYTIFANRGQDYKGWKNFQEIARGRGERKSIYTYNRSKIAKNVEYNAIDSIRPIVSSKAPGTDNTQDDYSQDKQIWYKVYKIT